ncbi:MAG: hypothetical protein K2X78_08885, partial [Burkholderiaceae bacterium]|nr:hypothetical protein [Burkholderiaceae bacterium]
MLSAQDEVLALGNIFEGAANSAANIGGMALDVTVDSLDTSAVAAWQGLVTPDAAGVPQATVQDVASVPKTVALCAAHVPQTTVQDAASMPQTIALGAAHV